MNGAGLPQGVLLATSLLSAATIAPALAPAEAPAPESPDRPADQTFLTYPEWFLVFSPDERATFLESGGPPSRFPYLGHLVDLWQGYAAVTRATRAYPFNARYHVMIVVIASSTNVEYGIEGLYEALVGRAFEALPGPAPEETYAARAARAYVDFIRVRPWYEFNFGHWLAGLWHEPLAIGPTLPRSLERRFWLTFELGEKALYGAFLGYATHASYVPAAPTTRITTDSLPDLAAAALPPFKRIEEAPGRVVLDVPRYQAFTDVANTLSAWGVSFLRIAGNDGAIALTAIVPAGWQPPPQPAPSAPYHELFEQPLRTVAGRSRAMLVTDVAHLSATLVALRKEGAAVEHVFDY
jgi:hypothetical protein